MENYANTQNGINYYNLFIDGKWIKSSSNEYIPVENPATEEIIGKVTNANLEDVKYALESSEKAQLEWQKVPILERCEYVKRLIDNLKPKKDFFAKILTKEQGKTYKEALAEVDDTISYMQIAIENARRIKGDLLPVKNQGEALAIKRVPYGVTLGLCAWNYPLALIGRKLAPALVTGNTMIIKPHELTPLATAEFFRIVEESNFPAGVINLITGAGVDVGNALVCSPITKLISVTGSVRAGQAIYKSASQNIAGLILELGGKAPFIVMEDADIDKAVEAAVISRYANCGQVCTCCDMIFVQESVAEEFTQKLLKKVEQIKVGDPFDSKTDMGPKMCKSDLEKIDGIVKKTVKQGAKILCGGKRPIGKQFEKGYWYEPTILTNVTRDMAAAQEEIFGPVLPILKIKDFDQAVEITNASPYGLASYLFTENYRTLIRASNELQVGTIFMNKCISGHFHGFHSGHKLSGLNGEDGEYGLDAFMQKRTFYINY